MQSEIEWSGRPDKDLEQDYGAELRAHFSLVMKGKPDQSACCLFPAILNCAGTGIQQAGSWMPPVLGFCQANTIFKGVVIIVSQNIGTRGMSQLITFLES